MGRGLLRLGAAVVMVLAGLGSATPATAATANPLTITTSSLPSGMVGVGYQASLSASGGNPPYTWSAQGLPAGLSVSTSGLISGTPTSADNPSFTVIVVDAGTPGIAPNGATARKALKIFIAAQVTTTTTTTTTLPPTTDTTVPLTTRTTSTRLPPNTSTTSSSVPDTTTIPATTSTPPTGVPPETTSTSTSVPAPGTPAIQLSRPSTEPGGQVVVTGTGCTPGADVRLLIADTMVGTAVADAQGSFRAPIAVPELAVGQYDVVALCGPTLSSPLDVVVATSVNEGTSTLGLFLFFLLLSVALFRRRRLIRRRPPAAE